MADKTPVTFDVNKFLEMYLKYTIKDMTVLGIAALVERMDSDFNVLMTFAISINMDPGPYYGRACYEFHWTHAETSQKHSIYFQV